MKTSLLAPRILILQFCLLAVSVMAQPTARQWNSEVVAGWNLGNQLESMAAGVDGSSTSIGNPATALQAETAWGNPAVTPELLQAVKAAGFNAVRVPVRWQCHVTDATTMTVDPQWLQRVKAVVDYCLACDLKVIINTHHDMWLESRPTYQYQDENNRLLGLLWTQVAEAFGDYDYRLAFAGTNEVHVPNNWNAPTKENLAVQNSYNQTFVDAVRATGGHNRKRHLIVQTYCCELEYGLNNGGFIIPNDLADNGNAYMSVEFHYYKPWDYCGGGAVHYWGAPYRTGDEQSLRNDFRRADDAWGSKGLGIIIGEWGVSNHWDSATNMTSIHTNMSYYCKTLVSEALGKGFATFVWDNGAFGNGAEKFGIFDRRDQMRNKAAWITKGISDGIATDIEAVRTPLATDRAKVCIRNRRVNVRRGADTYNLQGYKVKTDE